MNSNDHYHNKNRNVFSFNKFIFYIFSSFVS